MITHKQLGEVAKEFACGVTGPEFVFWATRVEPGTNRRVFDMQANRYYTEMTEENISRVTANLPTQFCLECDSRYRLSAQRHNRCNDHATQHRPKSEAPADEV